MPSACMMATQYAFSEAHSCRVPITGIKIDVCLIFTNFAIKGNPPARLMTVLFLRDFDKAHSLKP